MKKLLILGAIIIAAAGMATAASVVGSPHDLSSGGPGATGDTDRVCAFCHTPHQPTGQTTDPLWNHTLASTANYGVYASDTLDSTPADIGGAATVSNLCMSCHDGSVAVNSLYNVPNDSAETTAGEVDLTDGGLVVSGVLTGTALLGTDLTNDHPVNFDYDAALVTADGGGLNDPTSVAVSALLFGGTVQCASCHDPHDNQYTSFLVQTNTASALCLVCHIK